MDDNIGEQLKEMIWKGISVDIFYAERAYSLFTTIGDNANKIQNSRDYVNFFVSAQDALKDQFLLATSRLYDKPSKRNPTSSMEGVLEFLEKNISRLPNVIEQHQLRIQMSKSGFTELQKESINKVSNMEIANMIIDHYRKVILSEREVINNLKK